MRYRLTALLITAYTLLVRYTSRIIITGSEHPKQFWQNNEPVLIALWHGRLLFLPYLIPQSQRSTKSKNSQQTHVLISTHKDGMIISYFAKFFGLGVVAGSTKRNSISAARKLIKLAKNGHTICITPDAPPNLAYNAASGVADIAKLAKIPVIPCAISFTKGIQFNTKDRFVLPLPFSTVYISYSAPIHPQTSNKLTQNIINRHKSTQINIISKALNTLTQQLDKTTNNQKWS